MRAVFFACIALAVLAGVVRLTNGDAIADGVPSPFITKKAGERITFQTQTITLGDSDYFFVSLSVYSGVSDAFLNNPQGQRVQNLTLSSSEVARVDKNTPGYASGAYTLDVLAITDCAFSVLYSVHLYDETGKVIQISDGVTVVAFVDSLAYLDFAYNLTGPHALTFAMTPMGTDADLLVTYDNPPARLGNYEWKSISEGSDVISISQNDMKYHPSGIYSGAVYGIDKSWFGLSATMDFASSATLLLDRYPQYGYVYKGDIRQMKFYHARNSNFRVTCTSLNGGDADLFLSTTPVAGPDNYMWKALDFGDDEIRVEKTDKNFKVDAFYYIGVRGYIEGEFLLTFYTEGDAIALTDNAYEFSNATNEVPAMFFFKNIDDEADITFSVTDLEGSCQVYAASYPDPSKDKHEFAGVNTHDGQIIEIAPSGIPIFYASVFPKTGDFCRCLVTALSQTDVMVLSDGIPASFVTVPKGAYRRFVFNVTNPARDVIVSAAAINGDPDLYGAYRYLPRTDHSDFSATTLDSEQFVVLYNSEQFSLGTLYIAVFGFRDSTFSILAHTAGDVVELTNGDVIDDYVEMDAYQYYSFNVEDGDKKTLTISVADTFGDTDVYVCSESKCTRPSSKNYEFRSANFGGDYVTIVSPKSEKYYIGVLGYLDASSYEIMVYLSDSGECETLEEGVPLADNLATGEDRLYRVFMNDRDNFTISLLPLAGQTTVYVKVGQAPTTTDYDYVSTSMYPGNVINVLSGDATFKQGIWYLRVVATSDALFNVLVNFGNRAKLQDGFPIYDSVQMNEYSIARTIVYRPPSELIGNTSAGVEIQMVSFSGSENVYVALTNDPSEANNIGKAEGCGNHRIIIPYSKIFAGTTSNIEPLYIGVKGTVMGWNTFMVSSSGASAEITLVRGEPILSEVSDSAYRRFKSGVFPSEGLVSIVTETCDYNPPPTIYYSIGEKPTSTKNKGASTYVGKFQSLLQVDASALQMITVLEYGIQGFNGMGSMFSISKVLQEPPVFDEIVAEVDKDSVVLHIPTSNAVVGYSIVMATSFDANGNPTNLDTVCGCDMNAQSRLPFNVPTDFPKDPQGRMLYTFSPLATNVYRFNVVARDVNGLQYTYTSVEAFVSYPNDPLPANVPTGIALAAGSSTTFAFTFYDKDSDLQVSVTPLAGYTRTLLQYGSAPGEDAPLKDESKYPGNVIVVKHTDTKNFKLGNWFVKIENPGTVDVIAYVTLEDPSKGPIQLIAGVPTVAAANYQVLDLYSMPINMQLAQNGLIEVAVVTIHGVVDVYVSESPNPTTSPLAISRRSGSHFISLPASQFTETSTLYIGVEGQAMALNEYALLPIHPQVDVDILSGTPAWIFAGAMPQVFATKAPQTLGKVQMILEQCDNKNAPIFKMRDSTSKPFTQPSVPDGPYRSVMNIDHPTTATTLYEFQVPVQSGLFSVHRIPSYDEPYPVVGNVSIVGAVDKTSFTIKFPQATGGVGDFDYNVYLAFSTDDLGNPVNMETSCGCEHNRLFSSGFYPAAHFQKDAQNNLLFTFNNLATEKYVATVVARDYDGVMSVYGALKGVDVTDMSIFRAKWGQQNTGAVAEGLQLHYSFGVEDIEDIMVSVTPISGSTKACIKYGAIPDVTKSEGICSLTPYPGNAVDLSELANDFRVGNWFLSILALKDSIPSVYVFSDSDIAPVDMGMPIVSTVLQNVQTSFSYNVPNSNGMPGVVSVRSVTGSVMALVGKVYPVTTANAIAHSDPTVQRGNIELTVPAIELTAAQTTLYVAIVGTKLGSNKFLLSVATADQRSTLVENAPMESSATKTRPKQFSTQIGGSSAKTAHVSVLSCDNLGAPSFYFGRNRENPSPTSNDGKSTKTGTYSSSFDFTRPANEQVPYYFGVYPSESDVRMFETTFTVDGESAPVPTPGTLRIVSRDVAGLAVEFTPATIPPTVQTVEYQVLLADHKDSSGRVNQFTTSCAVAQQAFESTTFSSHPSDDTVFTHVFTDVDVNREVYVNVLVRTDGGVDTPYTKVLSLSPYESGSPSVKNKHSISGGSIFLIVLACLIFLYLVIGVIVNLVRGKRGKEIIPNYSFWRSLPGLVADGYIFLCRGSGQYNKFDAGEEYGDTREYGTVSRPETSTNPSTYGTL
eukprot:TRINITY_DN81011_c0_g1_i1.p1 TRINITY_DN81011_c0_g1~~TRINITY_DN81011_c0_g1_i1.p1  ORF type:complete len:2123 (-),score=413.47 TRINITY_DN81011_c0_g1_i1:321-6689(-)